MGTFGLERLAAGVFLLSLCGVATSQVPPLSYVDAPVGATTEVADLSSRPYSEGRS